MTIGLQMQAQVTPAQELEHVEKVDLKKGKEEGKKHQHRKRGKKAKHAKKAHLKSMRKVAKADGVITKEEKQVMKEEKRKMKRKSKKRRAQARKGKKGERRMKKGKEENAPTEIKLEKG